MWKTLKMDSYSSIYRASTYTIHTYENDIIIVNLLYKSVEKSPTWYRVLRNQKMFHNCSLWLPWKLFLVLINLRKFWVVFGKIFFFQIVPFCRLFEKICCFVRQFVDNNFDKMKHNLIYLTCILRMVGELGEIMKALLVRL